MTELGFRAVSGAADRDAKHRSSALRQTLPFVLVGSMAMTLGITTPAVAEEPAPEPKENTPIRDAVRSAFGSTKPVETPVAESAAALAAAPASYRVVAGDTVSGIAARYGLSTASVLALNGLGWSSLIFPGQILTLTSSTPPASTSPSPAPAPTATSHTVKAGDTVSAIAARYGVSTQSVLNANGLTWSSLIFPGQKLTIPGTTPASTAPAPAPEIPVDEAPAEEPPAEPTPKPAPAPAPTSLVYTIVSGDTISGIAARHGVSTQAVLDANGLGWSSIIHPGQKITIPGVAGSAPASAPNVTTLNPTQQANARLIIQVGRDLGVPDYGIVIALAAAMQESSMRNLDYGDRDSLGLFQQRPSTGWGTPAQIMDPVRSTKAFFGGSQNPNPGKTRGLLDIAGWQSMTVTRAAQAVQISAYPDAYAKWETSARAWLAMWG